MLMLLLMMMSLMVETGTGQVMYNLWEPKTQVWQQRQEYDEWTHEHCPQLKEEKVLTLQCLQSELPEDFLKKP